MRRRLYVFGVLLTCLIAWAPAAAATRATTCGGKPWPADEPCLTLTPAAGPVGTYVRVSGHLPRGHVEEWRTIFRENADDPLYGLTGDFGSCEIIGGIDRLRLVADRDGAVRGSFVVTGGSAPCKQEGGGPRHAFVPGVYTLDVSCMTCGVAVFTITGSGLGVTGFPHASLDRLMVLALVATATGAALAFLGRRRRTQ